MTNSEERVTEQAQTCLQFLSRARFAGRVSSTCTRHRQRVQQRSKVFQSTLICPSPHGQRLVQEEHKDPPTAVSPVTATYVLEGHVAVRATLCLTLLDRCILHNAKLLLALLKFILGPST